jgi:hypothetical protein
MRKHTTQILFLAAIALNGCGATHQFVPRERIPFGEGRYSLVWNYDLNGMSAPTIWPQLNLYMGIGHDYALGLGYQMLSLTHLSFVKYDYRGDGDYGAGYLHLNNVFGANNSPQIELGGAYFENDAGSFQVIAVGMGFGHRAPARASDADVGDVRAFLLGSRSIFMPHIKYAGGSDHWAVSYMHHFGLSGAAIAPLRYEVERLADVPGLTISAESVRGVDRVRSRRSSDIDGLEIAFNNGDTLRLTRYYELNCVAPSPPSPPDYWLGTRGYETYFVTRSGGLYGLPLSATVLDLDDFYTSLVESGSATLHPYSPGIRNRLRRVNTWRSDHSLGIVFTNRTPQDPNK